MDREATGLRRIAGIGSATERTLREAGVQTLEDLAGRPTDELAGITGKSQRAVGEWQARARELTGMEKPRLIEPDRQRSETFTVEVLLNEDASVRYVRAEHVFTQEHHAREDRPETTSWSDWRSAERELAGFLEEHAGLAAQPLEQESAAEKEAAGAEELQAVAGEPAAPPDPTVTRSAPAGQRIRQLATMPSLAGPSGVMPGEATPFTLQLPVILAQLGLAPEDRIEYQATVVAKRLGQPVRRLVGEASGTVEGKGNGRFDVLVKCDGLPAGTYRLETVLRLGGAGSDVVALLENALMEVRPAPGGEAPDRQATVVSLG